MTVPLGDIIDAIAETLGEAASIKATQSYGDLSSGIPDAPTLQVWPAAGNTDAINTNDRTTFKAGVRQSNYTINADLYARQRSHIGEDMAAMVGSIVEIEDILRDQSVKPYFGSDDIKSFRWSWEHVTFTNEGGNFTYVGARFTVQVWTFP